MDDVVQEDIGLPPRVERVAERCQRRFRPGWEAYRARLVRQRRAARERGVRGIRALLASMPAGEQEEVLRELGLVPARASRLGRSPSIELVGEEISPVGGASGVPWYALPGEAPPRQTPAARPSKCFLLPFHPGSHPLPLPLLTTRFWFGAGVRREARRDSPIRRWVTRRRRSGPVGALPPPQGKLNATLSFPCRPLGPAKLCPISSRPVGPAKLCPNFEFVLFWAWLLCAPRSPVVPRIAN